jgi:hypothetical protein
MPIIVGNLRFLADGRCQRLHSPPPGAAQFQGSNILGLDCIALGRGSIFGPFDRSFFFIETRILLSYGSPGRAFA